MRWNSHLSLMFFSIGGVVFIGIEYSASKVSSSSYASTLDSSSSSFRGIHILFTYRLVLLYFIVFFTWLLSLRYLLYLKVEYVGCLTSTIWLNYFPLNYYHLFLSHLYLYCIDLDHLYWIIPALSSRLGSLVSSWLSCIGLYWLGSLLFSCFSLGYLVLAHHSLLSLILSCLSCLVALQYL